MRERGTDQVTFAGAVLGAVVSGERSSVKRNERTPDSRLQPDDLRLLQDTKQGIELDRFHEVVIEATLHAFLAVTLAPERTKRGRS